MIHTFKLYKKRAVIVLCIISLSLSMTGCGGSVHANYKEIDTLQLIQTIGIDRGDDRVQLTVSSGQSLEDQPSVAISRSGESISSAIEQIQNYSSKEDLFFAHARFAVLGEDAGRELIPEFLDYLARSAKLRLDMTVFIVKESTAKTLLTQDGKKGFNATEGFASIEKVIQRTGVSYPFSGREIISSLAEYGSALVCSISPVQIEGSVFTEDGGTVTSVPAGYAVIKNGSLCAYLDPDLARAATILIGKKGYGSVPLELSDGAYATVYTEQGKTEYEAHWNKEGRPDRMTVNVELSCGLVEMTGDPDYDSEDKLLSDIARAMEEKFSRDFSAVLLASRELGSDFLGLKGFLRSKYPKEMAALPEDFPSVLSDLSFDLNVKCEVTRSYDFEQAESLMKGGKIS